MTEVELLEAMENQCPVIGITEFNGGIEYSRVLAVIRRRNEQTGKAEVFAQLQSSKYGFVKPEVAAEKIFLKE